MIGRLFRRVSLVQILLNIASSIAMIVDSVVIGQFIGVEALAAYGAVTPLLMIIMAVSQVLSTGGQIRCSEELGKNDPVRAERIASLTVLLGAVFSLSATLIAILFQLPICTVLGVSGTGQLLDYTRQYLVGFMLGAPAFVGLLVLVPFVQLDGDKKCVLRAVTVMTAGDIVGDLLVVLLFKGGMFGIGLASSISYYLALGILLRHFFSAKAQLHLRLKNLCFRETGAVLAGGLPAALQKVLRSLLSLTLNYVLLAVGGSTALGIFSAVNSILNLCNSVGQGMGAGTLLLTGIYSAEADRAGLKDIIKTFLKESCVMNTVMFLLVLLAAGPIVSLFLDSDEVNVTQTAAALRFGAADFVLFSVANCFKNFCQGIHNRKLTYLLTVSEAFLFSALAAWPLGRLFGVNGVCLVYAVGDLMTLLLLGAVLLVRKRTGGADSLLPLQPASAVPERDLCKLSLSSASALPQLLARLKDFLDDQPAEALSAETRDDLLSAAEEICRTVLDRGFREKGNHQLDVTVLRKDAAWSLRFRDDCRHFDAVQYAREKGASGESPAPGLSRVFARAESAVYSGTLGLNNLNLTFPEIREEGNR